MARILVTSALPYINGVKHLGNLAGSMLPADVFARAMRTMGHEVLALCATDEHGTPAELAAAEAGMDVRKYCDRQHELQKQAGDAFGLAWDWFGRSSSPQNHALTQHFADVLESRGLIEERTSTQIYSPTDGRFLPDRYVVGTCPNCGSEKARGDQCEACGKLLDPTDLINPRSAISGATDLERRETRHLYLLQSKMQDDIRAWVEARDWPSLAKSIAHKWLDEGLKDRAITRDLDWGVPVLKDGKPRPGFEDKVFYVWFDAPIEYFAIAAEYEKHGGGGDWKRWWRADQGAEDVTYFQFMGKDNVAFHTVSFPATVLGSGEPWKTVDRLKAFNWVTWYGGKFSTSEKRGVFMDQALELLPADVWRWHLIANAPESSDSAFTWESFQAGVNADLANNLGNFVNRITRFAAARFDSHVPEAGQAGAREKKLAADLQARLDALRAHYEGMEFRKAAAEIRAIWSLGNEYLQDAAPWTVFKTDPDAAAAIVRTGLNLARLNAVIAWPIVPFAADVILEAFGEGGETPRWPETAQAALSALKPGSTFDAPDVLFQKIEDEQVEAWRTRFGGEPG